MTLIKKRNRMVSIRLSDDEFRRLHEVCATTGARSISDLARDAMQRLVAGQHCSGGDEGAVCERLHHLDMRVTELQQELLRLSLRVETTE